MDAESVVKIFVENNIDDIDNESWEKVLLEWYDYSPFEDSYVDIPYFKKFVNTLEDAGVLNDRTKEDFNKACDQVIYEQLDYRLNEIFQGNSWRDGPYIIRFGDVYGELYSFLGLDLGDVIEILQTSFEDYPLEIGSGYFRVVGGIG